MVHFNRVHYGILYPQFEQFNPPCKIVIERQGFIMAKNHKVLYIILFRGRKSINPYLLEEFSTLIRRKLYFIMPGCSCDLRTVEPTGS